MAKRKNVEEKNNCGEQIIDNSKTKMVYSSLENEAENLSNIISELDGIGKTIVLKHQMLLNYIDFKTKFGIYNVEKIIEDFLEEGRIKELVENGIFFGEVFTEQKHLDEIYKISSVSNTDSISKYEMINRVYSVDRNRISHKITNLKSTYYGLVGDVILINPKGCDVIKMIDDKISFDIFPRVHLYKELVFHKLTEKCKVITFDIIKTSLFKDPSGPDSFRGQFL